MAAIQGQIKDNYRWGCGADNPDGLQLKSEWDGDGAMATWTPDPVHAAGPRHLVNGGIIATVLDCHGVCTAIADAYRRAGREVGTDPEIWVVEHRLVPVRRLVEHEHAVAGRQVDAVVGVVRTVRGGPTAAGMVNHPRRRDRVA